MTYNNENDIAECIDSILQQEYKNFEVVVVDNCSSDNTVAVIKKAYGSNPVIRLIQNRENKWYAGGNNVGFHESKGELVAVLNPDLVVDKKWLVKLVETYYQNKDRAGIVCSNVLLYDKRNVINACGNDIHLTGLVFSRFYMESECKCAQESSVVAAPSGASMLFAKEKLARIGRREPFDASRFTMEYSDIDLAIDFLSHDLLCFVSPESKVYHKYKFKMTPQRLYTLEKGRHQILGHITSKTLSQMRRALIIGELMIWYFILTKRQSLIGAKIRAELWKASHPTNREDNSCDKDQKILTAMISEISTYRELGTGSMSSVYRLNSIYRSVRQSVIDNLSKTLA